MAAEFLLREYREDDIPALTELWKEIFGDSDEVVHEFFRLLPEMGICSVAEINGEIVGMASNITALSLFRPGLESLRCGYVYAVATLSSARGRGIAAALTERVCALGEADGVSVRCTLPAEESLYPWYERVMGVGCALRRESFEILPNAAIPVSRINAAQYHAHREKLLYKRVHICASPAVISFADKFYSAYGGGLFLCGDAVCAAYGNRECIYVKELIGANDADAPDVAASLGAFLCAEKVIYFLPSESGENYVSAPADTVPAECIWNLTFD